MAYIGRQQSSGAFAKIDDISSQFNDSKTIFNLKIGNEAFFPGNPYTLLVSLVTSIGIPPAGAYAMTGGYNLYQDDAATPYIFGTVSYTHLRAHET